MSIFREKEIIYQLMHEIIEERRELSKQYFALKDKLDQIDKKSDVVTEPKYPPISMMEKEKILYRDILHKKNRTSHYIPFDRVSKNIVSILKKAHVPLSNKQILNTLSREYELSITLKNLSSNILPKMNDEYSIPVQRAHRGYWQYKLHHKEGS